MTLSAARRIFFALILFGSSAALAQSCPREDQNGQEPLHPVTLHGRIIYHDALRQWFGLRLNDPICGGQKEVQISANPGDIVHLRDGSHARIDELRGCVASVTGPLFLPDTGYYSSALEQVLGYIHPDPSCVRQPRFPDMSHAKADPRIRSYRVTYKVSHRGEGSIRAAVTHDGKELKPWQAYTSSFLTGSFVLYGSCAKGYEISDVSGSSEAKPELIESRAVIGTEMDGAENLEPIVMTFTCTRERHIAKKTAALK